MKNKYTKYVILILVITTNQLFSQQTYLTFNTGYGFKLNSRNLDGLYNITEKGNNTKIEQVRISLGEGFNFGGGIGYYFNNNIGTEISANYLFSKKSEVNHIDDDDNIKISLSSKMFKITPSIILKTNNELFNPYIKMGLTLGFGNILVESNGISNNDVFEKETKLNGGYAFGMSSAIGFTYPLGDEVLFYGELNMDNISYAPLKGEHTKYTENGVDQLQYMTTRQKEFEFVDEYTVPTNYTPSDSEPDKELKQYFPFSNFGVKVGLKFNL